MCIVLFIFDYNSLKQWNQARNLFVCVCFGRLCVCCVCEWVNEWMSVCYVCVVCVSEWMSVCYVCVVCVSEWMSEWVYVMCVLCVSVFVLCMCVLCVVCGCCLCVLSMCLCGFCVCFVSVLCVCVLCACVLWVWLSKRVCVVCVFCVYVCVCDERKSVLNVEI